jgi:hypothetical protein
MAALRSRYRRGGRRWMVSVTLAMASLFLAIFVSSSSANLPGSSFEGNDGNLVVNTAGNTDWANVGGVVTGIDKPSGSTDNAFGQGTKEDVAGVTVVTGSIPPNKNDLTRFYVASDFAGGQNFLYLGWERLVNIGNANLDFEINQNATSGFTTSTTGPVTLNRTAGDLLVTYDFGGSGTPTLGLLKWLTAAAGNTVSQCFSANALPCWGNRVDLTAAGEAQGAVNAVGIVDPLNGNASLGVGLFGEAAINLTAAGVFPPGVCKGFGSTFLKSRSSSSFTAEVKDFVAPQPVNISNCGTVIVHKVTSGGDDSFGYTSTGGLPSPTSFSLSNGQTQKYDGNVPAGSYTITENITSAQATAGWTLTGLVCTASGSGTTQSTSGATASFTVAPNGIVECTYTNHLQAHPRIVTAQNLLPNDVATISLASSTAGGNITFSLFPPSDTTCSGTATYTETVPVNGNGDYHTSNTSTLVSDEGTWRWLVSYSGDANNDPATSTCGTEHFVLANS